MTVDRTNWIHDRLKLVRADEREDPDFYTTGERKLYIELEDGKRFEISKGTACRLIRLCADHLIDLPNSLWE